MVAALGERIAAWHLAGLSGPRGVSVEAFAERLRGGAAEAGQRHASVAEALAAARAAAGEGERILVFGSFHTAAEALQALADG